jgi:hypothetical protein
MCSRSVVLTKVEDDDDIRMTQFARRCSLIPKPCEHLRLTGGIQGLDCHKTTDSRVISAKDLAEAATA